MSQNAIFAGFITILWHCFWFITPRVYLSFIIQISRAHNEYIPREKVWFSKKRKNIQLSLQHFAMFCQKSHMNKINKLQLSKTTSLLGLRKKKSYFSINTKWSNFVYIGLPTQICYNARSLKHPSVPETYFRKNPTPPTTTHIHTH